MDINIKRWREKDGRLIHDGDCYFWDRNICSCGLIHHLMHLSGDAGDRLGEWFTDEWARHESQLDKSLNLDPYVPPTKEELAERMKVVDELFGSTREP